MTIKTKQGGIFMNFDWIKTRADFDVEKPAVIDPFKGTQWTYQQLNILSLIHI